MKKKLGAGLLIFFCSHVLADQITTPDPNDLTTSLATQRTNQLSLFNQTTPVDYHNWPTQQINVHGFANFDFIPKTMQKTLPGEENDYFAMSNVGININAEIADFLNAYTGLAYFKTNKGQGDKDKNTGLMLDDAYLTVANFNQQPYFVRAGLFYLPFGTNDRYAIVQSLAELLSITREPGVQAGFVGQNGFSGIVYTTQGTLKNSSKKIQGALNSGASLYYEKDHLTSQNLLFSGGVQYINNMLQTNAISESDAFGSGNDIYTDKVGGVAAQLKVGYKSLQIFSRYITALSTSKDIIKYYLSPTNKTNPVFGAKPSAWDLGFLVKHTFREKPTQLDFTYSKDNQTAGMYIFNSTLNHPMPSARYIAGYTVSFTSNILARFEWAHDWLYKVGSGDTGRQGDAITLRLGVQY